MANSIAYQPSIECVPAKLGRAFHYKGFGSRIDFNDEETKVWADHAVAMMERLQPDTLVWDGDSHDDSSFTSLISRIRKNGKPRLVMFLRDQEEDRKRVEESWRGVAFDEGPVTIDCYLVDGGIEFDQLGHLAMQATHAKDVVSLGGGCVVEREFHATLPDVTYHLVPVKRRSQGSDEWEYCSLAKVQKPNLRIASFR